MIKITCITCILLSCSPIFSQTVLNADGPGETYELIASVLAPGYRPIEAPGIKKNDCDNHSGFKDKHITEVKNSIDNEMK